MTLTLPSINGINMLQNVEGLSGSSRYFLDPVTIVLIDQFTVVCLLSWPLNESEAGVNLVLIETFLLLC